MVGLGCGGGEVEGKTSEILYCECSDGELSVGYTIRQLVSL